MNCIISSFSIVILSLIGIYDSSNFENQNYSTSRKEKDDNYESHLNRLRFSYYSSFDYLTIKNFIVHFYNPRIFSPIQYSFRDTLIDVSK